MSVHHLLFRVYRPIIVVFALLLFGFTLAITSLVVFGNGHIGFSLWLVLAGSSAKYWPFVVGIMLVWMQLRQFVTNGATRREFLTGATVFGLIVTAGFAVVVVAGRGFESLLLGAGGWRDDGYPTMSPAGMMAEFGRVFAQPLGYLVSGALIGAGFYRWRVRIGLAVMIGGAVPAIAADALLGIDEFGNAAARLPYEPGLALTLAATALAGWAVHRVIGDVAIRRTAG